MKEQFVAKRIVNIGLIFLVAIGFSVIAGMMGRMYLDQLLGIGALTVLFMVLFAFLLIYERKRKRISNNRETDYGKIFKGFLLSAILTVIFLFLPEFTSPVMILPILMSERMSLLCAVPFSFVPYWRWQRAVSPMRSCAARCCFCLDS